jgi:hypothetical protein
MPWVLNHLLTNISTSAILSSAPGPRRQNPKLLEAALDLLAVLVKGQPDLAGMVRSWSSFERESEDTMMESVSMSGEEKDRTPLPVIIGEVVDLLVSGPTTVRIAAASWSVPIQRS